MEEVAGSNRAARYLFQMRKESKLGTDGVDDLLHAFRNLLHINVSCRCDAGVPEHALDVLHRPLLLRQRRNRAPDHLEGQHWQLKFQGQPVQNPLPDRCTSLADLPGGFADTGFRGKLMERSGTRTAVRWEDAAKGDPEESWWTML